MIFNVVVDSIIWNLVVVVVEETEAGADELCVLVQDLAEYFYMDDWLVMSTQTEMLHRSSDVLTDLLYRVGIRTNAQKTVIMDFWTYQTPIIASEVFY